MSMWGPFHLTLCECKAPLLSFRGFGPVAQTFKSGTAFNGCLLDTEHGGRSLPWERDEAHLHAPSLFASALRICYSVVLHHKRVEPRTAIAASLHPTSCAMFATSLRRQSFVKPMSFRSSSELGHASGRCCLTSAVSQFLLNISPRASGAIPMVADSVIPAGPSKAEVISIPIQQPHDCQQNESGGTPSGLASVSSLTPSHV